MAVLKRVGRYAQRPKIKPVLPFIEAENIFCLVAMKPVKKSEAASSRLFRTDLQTLQNQAPDSSEPISFNSEEKSSVCERKHQLLIFRLVHVVYVYYS